MSRVLILAGESDATQYLLSALSLMDAQAMVATDLLAAHNVLAAESPDLAAVDLGLSPPGHGEMNAFLDTCKKRHPAVPVLAVIPSADLATYEMAAAAVDDFALGPSTVLELSARMQRLLRQDRTAEETKIIRFANLAIDLARYEVIQDGRRVELTFKEYELLKFLATNRGKVFTRETLLNRVWGYDYFGGTRTVDVHIRRLRSKIETGSYTVIDTVRNVGYRFAGP